MMDLSAIRNTGIDWACTIEEKLRQLHIPTTANSQQRDSRLAGAGSNFQSGGGGGGNLVTMGGAQIGHLWKLGKHRILSSTGVLQESVDADYHERVRASTQSKALLLQIENEFKSVVDAVDTLSTHYDTLLSLLEKFRATCDDQLARDVDQEEMRVWEQAQPASGNATKIDDNASNDFVVIPPPPTMTAASNGATHNHNHNHNTSTHHASKGEQARYRITPVDATLASLRKSLVKSSSDLRENVKNSCQPISLATRTELDKTQTSIISEVSSKKATFDLTKHKARNRGLLVVSANNSLSGGPSYTTHTTNASSSSATLADPSNATTVVTMPANPTAADLNLREELCDTKESYDIAATIAKHKLHFMLEQTSMSTWACYNVFFQLMANYYGEVLKSNASLAKVLVELKNEQTISQKLTAERKQKLIARTEAVLLAKETERRATEQLQTQQQEQNGTEEFGEFLSASQSANNGSKPTPKANGSSETASDWDAMFS